MKPLPAHEQLSVSTDLPLIERWIEENPQAGAEVAIDRAAFDSNMGHVLLVVSVREVSELRRARRELVDLTEYPERLRVRRWQRDMREILRLQEWVHANQPPPGDERARIAWSYPDPGTGLLMITLDRKDDEFAAYLEAVTNGLAKVEPEPGSGEPLA